MNIPVNTSDNGRRRERPGWIRRRGTAAIALVAAGSLTVFAISSGGSTPALASVSTPPSTTLTLADVDARTVGAGSDSYAPIVERVAPTVVTIRSTRVVRAPQQFPFGQDPFSERFFGQRRAPGEPQERREGGLGSGVIVSADGYVLTNHHVIEGAEDITVELRDRRTFKATVVGSDPPSDLAVLRINGTGFPTLTLGDSDRVRVGDVVLAVGNPLGIGQTVTMGIVSAKGRSTGLGDGSFEDFLQTDAPINRGNSGGPLVNTRGELVGINSQIGRERSVTATLDELPSQHAARDADVDERASTNSGAGLSVQPLTPELARRMGIEQANGLVVTNVDPSGPGSESGFLRGDVIEEVNGKSVGTVGELRQALEGANDRPALVLVRRDQGSLFLTLERT